MTPPLGIYVHVPFCLTRCGYCDFNTYTSGDRGAYVTAALAEIDRAADALRRPVDTVFFGGGTPTLLTPEQVGRLLDAIRDRLGLADDVEVTIEANPDTVDRAALARAARGRRHAHLLRRAVGPPPCAGRAGARARHRSARWRRSPTRARPASA